MEFNPGFEFLIRTLNSIQTELKVPKKQVNKFGNYKFRNCDDIIEAVKPLLAKYQVVLLMSDTVECINNNTYIKATASLVDDKGNKIEVSAYAREVPEKTGILVEPMLTGSASSYARKYALNGLFALDDAKDPDDFIQLPGKEEKVENSKIMNNQPTNKQFEFIKNYVSNMNIEAFTNLMDFYCVDTIEDLNKEQATDLIAKIYKGEIK